MCIRLGCQVRELMIDGGRDIMSNLDLCVFGCFLYTDVGGGKYFTLCSVALTLCSFSLAD